MRLHKYIVYNIEMKPENRDIGNRKRWAINKLDKEKLRQSLKMKINWDERTNAEEACEETALWLRDACDNSIPKCSNSANRTPYDGMPKSRS